MTGVSSIISGIEGLASGGTQYFQPVQQQGGITPFENDYTQYGYQEGLLQDASQFAGTGTGQSTMASQAPTGTRMAQALQQGQISDTNAGAILNATRIGEQAQAQTTQQNYADLSTLGGLANSASLGNLFTQGFNSQSG